MTNEHVITIKTGVRIEGRWWRPACSCGKYRPGIFWYPGYAERAGQDHVNAKTGNPRG